MPEIKKDKNKIFNIYSFFRKSQITLFSFQLIIFIFLILWDLFVKIIPEITNNELTIMSVLLIIFIPLIIGGFTLIVQLLLAAISIKDISITSAINGNLIFMIFVWISIGFISQNPFLILKLNIILVVCNLINTIIYKIYFKILNK